MASHKFLLGLAILLSAVVAAETHAQSEKYDRVTFYTEGGQQSAAQREKFISDVVAKLRSMNELNELKGLRGDSVITSVCTLGYVRNIEYKFSTKNIVVISEKVVDCTGGDQCRAVEASIDPQNDQEPYDVSIKLKCSDDDTLVRRNRTELELPQPDKDRQKLGGR